MFQSCVKKLVLVNILFFFEFSAAGSLLDILLMRCFQCCQFFFVADLFRSGFCLTGSCCFAVVFLVVMLVQIADCLADQLINLRFFQLFNFLCLFQLFPVFKDNFPLLVFCQVGVLTDNRYVVVQRDNLIRSVFPQLIDLFLDTADVFIDRPEQFLLRCLRQNRFIYHVVPSYHRYFALSLRSSSWSVSFVLTIPARRPFDITPIRFVIPNISGISEETTIIVFPILAILIISS